MFFRHRMFKDHGVLWTYNIFHGFSTLRIMKQRSSRKPQSCNMIKRVTYSNAKVHERKTNGITEATLKISRTTKTRWWVYFVQWYSTVKEFQLKSATFSSPRSTHADSLRRTCIVVSIFSLWKRCEHHEGTLLNRQIRSLFEGSGICCGTNAAGIESVPDSSCF